MAEVRFNRLPFRPEYPPERQPAPARRTGWTERPVRIAPEPAITPITPTREPQGPPPAFDPDKHKN